MTAAVAIASPAPRIAGADYVRSRATVLLHFLVALWVFSGGFVISEPAPYEPLFLLVLAVSLVGGLTLYRSTALVLILFVLFVPFALIAAFQVKFMTVTDALIFQAVTIFLFLTSYFTANFVAEAPQQRMRLIVRAYIAGAVVTALLGIGGYLGVIPGGEALFTRYFRAKGAFQDPNVFAPFLILPAAYLLQRVLLGGLRQALWAGGLFLILLIGVFTSFSRAGWGSMALAALIVFLAVFFLVAHAREKARILLLSIAGTMVIVVAIGGLLTLPTVQQLFELRAGEQSYDTGETGRFGRQGYAFELALQNPEGLGPLEFRNYHIREEPHNSYVTVLHAYGWGGGLMWSVLALVTAWRGVAAVLRPSPNRLLLIPLVATYIPLAIEAAIIDMDHWRHFYLLIGLIWGVTAGYQTVKPGEERRLSALV